MDNRELLRKLGHNINPAPRPDVFGRRPATPLEIEDAMKGFNKPPKEQVVFEKRRRRR